MSRILFSILFVLIVSGCDKSEKSKGPSVSSSTFGMDHASETISSTDQIAKATAESAPIASPGQSKPSLDVCDKL
jgi:uncharacterized lipoprotein YehR (DUF1307 family)